MSSSFPSASQAHAAQQSIPRQAPPGNSRRNEFVVGLLTDLQRRHYSAAAWWRFFADSWRKSRATAQAHPALTRSWIHCSLFVAFLALCGLGGVWQFEGGSVALHILPALACCLFLQQGAVYVHLGLNWRPSDGFFREHLGTPTLLTLARGVMANLLLAHVLSGTIPLPGIILGVYLLGIATDIADGQVARHTNWQTRLGGNLDGEADLFLSTSTALCALCSGALPAWIAATILLRFAVPLAGALFSYFVAIHLLDFTHTPLGKVAGCAQAAVLILVFVSKVLARTIVPISSPLLLLPLASLIAAPIIEIRKNIVSWWSQKRETQGNVS